MFIVFAIILMILVVFMAIYFYKFYKNEYKLTDSKIKKSVMIFTGFTLIGIMIRGVVTGIIVFIILFFSTLLFNGLGKYFKGIKLADFSLILGILLTGIIILVGVFTAYDVKQTSYSITTDKMEEGEKLSIAMIADVHLGVSITSINIEKYAKEIEKQKPDIVLLVGDIFDDSTKKEEMEKTSIILGDIKSTYGTYYVYGNHDTAPHNMFSELNEDMVLDNLLKNGINVINDETVLIDDWFYLVGRNDISIDNNRESFHNLIKDIDLSKPVIVLDHQPLELDVLADKGVDLALSGHTHNDQIFPGNLIVGLIYNNSYGLKTIGDFNSVVTSGIGTWGTPIRLGTISEYVLIELIGRSEK
ncbi:metallophosphoesterase [Vallitalea okinawensis]|uniref:metallophosphoesterase n=1 Tax=Vallitalea okinawensis TaxID=2078660 RepID=UPI000CFDFFB6|nr:metallophosphoesterase [Vallitalea okinawensis]